MRLQSISLENFRSYGHQEIDLSGVSVASVVGSNGAGKSSLIDAVKFALFGKAGITGNLDSYIRRGEEEARVSVIFQLASGRYRVTRTRSKRGSGKSTVELARFTGEAWVGDDTGAMSVEDRIHSLLGIDAKLLRLTSIVEQGDAGSFFNLQPADRLQAFASILRLDEQYGPLEDRFKAEAAEADRGLKEARADAERLELDVASLEAYTTDAERAREWRESAAGQLASFEQQLVKAQERAQVSANGVRDAEAAERRLADLLAADSELGARIAKLETEAGGIDRRLEAKPRITTALEKRPALEAELAQLDEAEKADAAIYAERSRLNGLRANAETRANDLKRREDAAQTDVGRARSCCDKITEKIRAIADSPTPICDRCGQAIADAALAKTLEQLRDDLRSAAEQAKGADELLARLVAERQEAASDLLHLEADLSALPETSGNPTRAAEIRQLLSRLDAAAQELAALGPLEERRATITTEIRDLENRRDDPAAQRARQEAQEAVDSARVSKETLAADQAAVDDLTRSVASKRKEVSDADIALGRAEGQVGMLTGAPAELEAKRAEIAELEQTYADTALLRKHMSKWGVPAYIVGNVLRQLEIQVNELLSLYDGGFAIRFESEKETRDGARDSLEILVFDGSTWDNFEVFSGGEKFRIASAMRFGLAQLLAHRSGARVGTLLVDEPEGLDVNGRQHLARILEHLGQEFSLVLCLTHYSDLQDAFPSQVMVSRGEDGLSQVRVVN